MDDVAEEREITAVGWIDVTEQGAVRAENPRKWSRVKECWFRYRRKEEVPRQRADALAVRRGKERHRKKGAGDVPVSGRATTRVRCADGLLNQNIGGRGLAVDAGEIGTS